ncbi:MAG: hypothetical protein LBG97_04330 [Coriobacteriales bacterium]|jgi:DMSO reductase anchor subunit|nr:hypothetical protein [Coriobacteriales bacterium]
MQIQWELILFTSLIAWSAGLFGTQALAAVFWRTKKIQLTSWIVAAVLLIGGGVAVFLHLKHWERIFNGFGHLTSGITQELIALVILVVVAIAYLVVMLRSVDKASVPKWLSILAVAVSVILVVVMAHSYMMVSRPAWDSFIWVAYVLGNSLVLGPATFVLVAAFAGGIELKKVGKWLLIGSIANLLFAIAYAVFVQLVGSSFAEVGMYFDPNHPTKAMADINAIVDAQILLLWLGAVIIGSALPVIVAFVAQKKNDIILWKVFACVIVVCVIAGAIAMRVVFYNLGLSVLMFY